MVSGIIEDTASYPIAAFRKITGLGTAALRTAEANGLEVTWVGNQKWISGAKWNEYLKRESGKPKYRKEANACVHEAGQ